MATIKSVNPYTGQELESYKEHTKSEMEDLLKKADRQFAEWRKTSFSERAGFLIQLAGELKKNKEEYGEMMTKEMGKPISQSIAEIEKCAWVCEYYADNGEDHLKREVIDTDADKSYITYEPLGVVLAIMPWNYPFWQVFRFAAPAVMAGNIPVLKHASNVFGCALLIEKAFQRAGFPKSYFTTLLIGSDKIDDVIKNPIVKAVTLTGSEIAGTAVGKTAGENIKKSVLELGGSNALVVFKDADMDKTVDVCIRARFQNTGQSCIAGKRLLVDQSISEEFTEKLVKKTRELKSGDTMNKDTYIGTLAREDLAKTLEEQVNKSLKKGAKVLLGGNRHKAYFEPTILTNVTEDMPVFQEETFGPVLTVNTFKTEEEAVKMSNTNKFGLGVSLFSEDISRMEKIIPHFEEGAVFVNELVKSDPRLPFGGVKNSGYGRELSKEGIREFVNIKTVFIKK